MNREGPVLRWRHGDQTAVVIRPRIAVRHRRRERFCGMMSSIGWALG